MNRLRILVFTCLILLVVGIFTGCAFESSLSKMKKQSLVLDAMLTDNLSWIETSYHIGWTGLRHAESYDDTVLITYDFLNGIAGIQKIDSSEYNAYVSCINLLEKEFNPEDYNIHCYDSNSTGHIVEISKRNLSNGDYQAVGIVDSKGVWREIIDLKACKMSFTGAAWLDCEHILLALHPKNEYYTGLFDYDLQTKKLSKRMANEGKQICLYTDDPVYTQKLSLSPDGKYIAYASTHSTKSRLYGELEYNIIVQSIDTGKAAVLFSEDESYAKNIEIQTPNIIWYN